MKPCSRAIRPTVLTIAGHDPSGGAGLSADLKVFEAWDTQGISVCTALTVQNEKSFAKPGWVAWPQILDQLEALAATHIIDYCKIGLVESAETLVHIVMWIRSKNPSAFIVWDPILKASAGFDFHSEDKRTAFVDITHQLSLITPNQLEFEWLGKNIACPVLLKGGHQEGEFSVDRMLVHNRIVAEFSMPRLQGFAKHGTGCVLSASIVALMAHGLNLTDACKHSRELLQNYLQSTQGLLGVVSTSIPPGFAEWHKYFDIARERLYVITWDEAKRDLLEQVQTLCEQGVRTIQLRIKNASKKDRLHFAWQALRICRQWGSLLVINDDVEIACAVRAEALHLGLLDMPIVEARKRLGSHVLIGGTANTPEHVAQRIAEGADYVGLGPWRFTGTKKNLSPVLGVAGVEAALKLVKELKPTLPVFVIGGILPSDCKEIMEMGASGVAVSSAIVASEDPQKNIQEFRTAFAGQGLHL